MTLIVDAGALIALADADDPHHQAAAALLHREPGGLVTTEAVITEADHVIMRRLGVDVELAFLDSLADGLFIIECLNRADLAQARDVARTYRDLTLGIADASLVVAARRHRTTRIATFDERAFRAVAPLHGVSFTVLPADEP